jgi:ATP-binding cassette subfamily F protein uup
MDMVEWLEDYLSRQSLALLLVTHDRYFLDRVVNEIFELENRQLYRYKGNYSFYLENKAEREATLGAEIDKSKNLLRKELEWMRRQPKARGTKSKSRIDAYYQLEEKANQKKQEQELSLEVKMTRLGGKIIEFEHVSKRFDQTVILDDFSYIFQKKDRVGIVGPNGVGKTTFLEMLTGKMTPDKGNIVSGETVVFGYYTQAGIKLPEDKRVIEVVTDIADVIPLGNGSTLSASQFLQQFGFEPARQYTFVSKLSGGEKRRLHLLTVLIRNPNFLILDEPTNDLDIITLNTLEDFLFNFPGCLLIVSHDRYFLDKLANHLFIFEGKGQIRDYNGSYSSYRELKEDEEEMKKNLKKPQPIPQPLQPQPAQEAKRKASFKEKREYEELEKEIAALEARRTELETLLSGGKGTNEDFMKWSQELETVKNGIESKTDRWLELSEFI